MFLLQRDPHLESEHVDLALSGFCQFIFYQTPWPKVTYGKQIHFDLWFRRVASIMARKAWQQADMVAMLGAGSWGITSLSHTGARESRNWGEAINSESLLPGTHFIYKVTLLKSPYSLQTTPQMGDQVSKCVSLGVRWAYLIQTTTDNCL